MPHANSAVLRTRQNDGQLGVEAHSRHVVGVSLQASYAVAGLVVPYLHHVVVSPRHEERAVTTAEVADTVDTYELTIVYFKCTSSSKES